jgi:hypothetical protein
VNTPDGESQAKLDALCYAWSVLAVGAAAEGKIWDEHANEVKLWIEVHARDVNTWCQDQKELWNILWELACEPTEKKLCEKFIKKIKDKDIKLPEKGISGGKRGDIEIHIEYWGLVAEYAKSLNEHWSKLEIRTEADIHRGTTSCSLDNVANLADEACEVWGALEYWATYPLNSEAEKRFREKSDQCLSRIDELSMNGMFDGFAL